MDDTPDPTPRDDSIAVETSWRFAMVPESVLWHPDLSAVDVRVYASLSRFGNGSGERRPSRATLAGRCAVSKQTIDRSLRKLVKVGAVAIKRNKVTSPDGTVSNRASTYTLLDLAPPVAPPGTVGGTRGSTTGEATPSTTGEALPKEEHRKKNTEDRATSADEVFEAFWKLYPRKIGKPKARTAFAAALRKGTTVGQIVTGLRPWIVYWSARGEPEFVPHPTTWLNQRRWEDDPPTVATPRVATRAAGREAREATAVAATLERFEELRGAARAG